MQAFWMDIKEFFYGIWVDFTEFIKDIFLDIFELLLDGIAYMIEQISVPDFITNGLGAAIDTFPPTVLYLMSNTGISTGLGILATAFSFRLIRKVATLFQW